jgi:MFS transporter, YNFM family, putative membrane transport protein
MHWPSLAMSSQSLSEDSSLGTNLTLNLAVFAAGIATFVNLYCTQAILPILAKAFAVAPRHVGLTITAPLLATAMIAPVIGAISDRFGRRKLILGAAILLIVPTALAAEAQSFNALVFWRFVQGLMLPFIFTVTIAYIADETSGRDTVKLAATYMSGTIFGGFSGRAITGLATEFFGWRIALLLVAAITLAMAVIIGLCLPPERRFRPVSGFRAALQAFPMHLSNPRLLATYGVGFGMLFNMIAVFTFINFRLAAAPYHLGPAALGGIFVVYLGGMIMSPLSARLANRFGRRHVMLFAAPTTLAGLGFTLAGPLPYVIFGLLLITMALFVQQTLATGFVGMVATRAKSAAVGLYVTVYYIGGSLGGIAPGGLWHDFHWPGCVALVALMQLAMLSLTLRFWGPLKQAVLF